jgi:glutathione S-transferase
VFGPVFRYFDVFDAIGDFGFFAGLTKLSAWRAALAQRASVRAAARRDHPALLRTFLLARHSALSRRMTPAV